MDEKELRETEIKIFKDKAKHPNDIDHQLDALQTIAFAERCNIMNYRKDL